jgi:hypothetical protein
MALSTITSASLAAGTGGKILQVKYTQFTGTNVIALSANTDTALTDLTVDITPTATNSVILLQAHVFGEQALVQDNQWNHTFFFYRDTTKLAAPAAGNRRTGVSMATITFHIDGSTTPEIARYDYFDEPTTTSAITYKVGLSQGGAGNFALNSTVQDTDTVAHERGISFISATEIAG